MQTWSLNTNQITGNFFASHITKCYKFREPQTWFKFLKIMVRYRTRWLKSNEILSMAQWYTEWSKSLRTPAFCIVIIRYTETFWSLRINRKAKWLSFNNKALRVLGQLTLGWVCFASRLFDCTKGWNDLRDCRIDRSEICRRWNRRSGDKMKSCLTYITEPIFRTCSEQAKYFKCKGGRKQVIKWNCEVDLRSRMT